MIKKNWKVLLITSIAVLLPIVAGVILWEQLPEQMPNHWNINGEVDDWSSKPFAVFGMPLILLALQWVCVFATATDPKKASHSEKMMHMVFWIVPVISILLHALTYMTALGKQVEVNRTLPLVFGLFFVIFGNYLPKCKQNYTIGIRISWTLNSGENWTKTHRFASWIWVIGGLLILLTGFVGGFWIFLLILFAMVLLPIIYSYRLHRKGI